MWREGARGVIALVEGRYDDAVEAFWRFDQDNECQTCSYAWLARTLDEAGQSDSAMVLLEEFVNFPSAEIWYDAAHLAHGFRRLGEYFEASGNVEKAIDYYSRYVDLREDADPQFQAELARVKSAISRLTEEPRR
jgi:tetratricopeptide (TPR) repeat protein